MDVVIRMHGLRPSAAFEAHARARLRAALARFLPEVRQVDVVLADVNGPRGGADLRCRLVARVRGSGSVVAEALASDGYAALDAAVARLERGTERATDRVRAFPRRSVRLAWSS